MSSVSLASLCPSRDCAVPTEVIAATQAEGRCSTLILMADEARVLSAEELETLPMGERQRLAAESIVSDLADVDSDFVARARRRGRELLEERGIDLPPA